MATKHIHMGELLRGFLDGHGISQVELADRNGRTRQWANELLNTPDWRISTLYRVANSLKISPQKLLPN